MLEEAKPELAFKALLGKYGAIKLPWMIVHQSDGDGEINITGFVLRGGEVWVAGFVVWDEIVREDGVPVSTEELEEAVVTPFKDFNFDNEAIALLLTMSVNSTVGKE